jgi:hypothetical protein
MTVDIAQCLLQYRKQGGFNLGRERFGIARAARVVVMPLRLSNPSMYQCAVERDPVSSSKGGCSRCESMQVSLITRPTNRRASRRCGDPTRSSQAGTSRGIFAATRRWPRLSFSSHAIRGVVLHPACAADALPAAASLPSALRLTPKYFGPGAWHLPPRSRDSPEPLEHLPISSRPRLQIRLYADNVPPRRPAHMRILSAVGQRSVRSSPQSDARHAAVSASAASAPLRQLNP